MFESLFGRRDLQYYLGGLETELEQEFALFKSYLDDFYKKKLFLEKVKTIDIEQLKILFSSSQMLIGREEREEFRLLKLTKAALNQAKMAERVSAPAEKPQFSQISRNLENLLQVLIKLEKILRQESILLKQQKFNREEFSNLVNAEANLLTSGEFILTSEIKQIAQDLQRGKVSFLPALYGRLMRKTELKRILEAGTLVQPAPGQNIVPTFTGPEGNVMNIAGLSAKARSEFHRRQMGGDGTFTEVLVFRSAENPVSVQHFQNVKGLTQAFFRPGTRIFIVYPK